MSTIGNVGGVGGKSPVQGLSQSLGAIAAQGLSGLGDIVKGIGKLTTPTILTAGVAEAVGDQKTASAIQHLS